MEQVVRCIECLGIESGKYRELGNRYVAGLPKKDTTFCLVDTEAEESPVYLVRSVTPPRPEEGAVDYTARVYLRRVARVLTTEALAASALRSQPEL